MDRQWFDTDRAGNVGLDGCFEGDDTDEEAAGNDTDGSGNRSDTESIPDNGVRPRPPSACVGADPVNTLATDDGDEQFIVDSEGRVVLLHGVNVVYKREPYYPHPGVFDESDVQKIRSWGFNFVRLGAIWAGVEPASGEFDQSYLHNIRDLVRLFAEYGIYVLVDYHQNLYSHVLGGDGAPEWAVYTEGELEDYEYNDVEKWAYNYAKPAVSNALRNFFTNHEGIQDEYAKAWRETAATLSAEQNVVGYSLMNEPTPPPGMAEFETDVLPGMYTNVIEEIRTVDTETPVWVEPSAAVFNLGGQTSLRGVADPADHLVFSFHNYHGDSREIVQNAVEATDRLGMPGVQTEFSTGNSTAVAATVDELDGELMGWAYWPYDESTEGWQSPAEYPPDFIGLDGGAGRKHLKYLVRPYPRTVAGVPTTISFDRVGREFHLKYKATDTSGTTIVFVPDRQFNDPTITVDGATTLRHEDEYLYVGDHWADTVKVTVSEAAIYRVENVHSGKVLTAPIEDAEDTIVIQREWEERDRQRWRVVPIADERYRIDNVATGETLTVRGSSKETGADILLRPWEESDGQHWQVRVTSNAASTLQNSHSGKVLNVGNDSTADGTNVQQWAAAGDANQQWRLHGE